MNIEWYRIKTEFNIAAEAFRSLPRYEREIEGHQPASLLLHELTKENYAYICHPALEGGACYKEGFSNAYREQFHKIPKKNAVFGSCVITLPREFGRENEDFPDISGMSVEEAKKAIAGYYAKEQGVKDWLEAAVDSFITVMHIRKSDVLYATVHLDETTPHVHIGFYPAYQMLDSEKQIRKDTEGDIVYGCDRSIVNRPFLKQFHKKMVEEMEKTHVPYADALITGEGFLFDPQKMSRQEREEATAYMLEDEILQAKVEKGLVTEEEAEESFHYKKMMLKNKESLLKRKEKEIAQMDEKSAHIKNKFREDMMDILTRLQDAQGFMEDMIKEALKDFRIEALGLTEKETDQRITVLTEELLGNIQEIFMPVHAMVMETEKEIEEEGLGEEDVFSLEG